jgi:hypothetical protein
VQKLFPIALTLHSIYGQSFEDNLQLRLSNPLHPWAVLMAFIVAAAKLAYKLDGKEPILSDVASTVDWLQWARSHFSEMQLLSAYPLKSAEVLQSDPAALSPYLKHLREVFFSSCSVPESLTEYHTLLKRFSEDITLARSNVAADRSEEINRTSRQPSNVDMCTGDSFEFAGKSRQNAATIVPLGPEYAALLSVCSIKTWIAPHMLVEVISTVAPFSLNFSTKLTVSLIMQAVRQLEELIVNVECEAAYRVDPHAQRQIAAMEKEAQLLYENQS